MPVMPAPTLLPWSTVTGGVWIPVSDAARMIATRLLILLAMAACPVCLALASGADAAAKQEAQLQQLRARIGALKNEMNSMRGQKESLDTELEKTERDIGAAAAAVRRLDQKIALTQARLDDLGQEREDKQRKLRSMRTVLSRDLRSAYVMGQQQQVKLLLNQEDPAAVARLMTYHGYFTRTRANRIQGIKATLEELATIEQEVGEQKSDLKKLKAEQIEASGHLEQRLAQRKKLLTGLQVKLQQKSVELTAMERDEQHLQQLVESLRKALRDMPQSTAQYKTLGPLKGRLVWPVDGPIDMAFGVLQADGKLRSRGVFVSAPAGSDVHAIASGRVVFSDWLRGFGLLLIIDHGKGYMSLYGYNRSLFREVGERVEAGDIIATVGESGGRQRPGLYLELRKDGRPFDPAPWFAGKPSTLRAGG
jgi:septal ring factor EnvC (AmiA/AmiB activator)